MLEYQAERCRVIATSPRWPAALLRAAEWADPPSGARTGPYADRLRDTGQFEFRAGPWKITLRGLTGYQKSGRLTIATRPFAAVRTVYPQVSGRPPRRRCSCGAGLLANVGVQ